MMKAAIFDVDGTILDTMPMWEGAADAYLATLGIVSDEDLNKKFLSATVETVASYMKEKFNLKQTEGKLKIVTRGIDSLPSALSTLRILN